MVSMLARIPYDYVEQVWPEVEPLLNLALDKSQRDYDAEDIKTCLLNRDMQLWGWFTGKIIDAVAITRIAVFPKRKILQLMYLGGAKMSEWRDSEETLCEWAKSYGCEFVEGYGRRGWLLVLKDWFDCGIVVRRAI